MAAEQSPAFETFPNPHPHNDYTMTISTQEFTCLCPMTGAPDFATITIEYVPGERIVELKNLRDYLASFRNQPTFHEEITNRILNDLVGATKPRRMSVTADFTVRGGLHAVVTASYSRPADDETAS
ncbi:MAG: preQ(1) synthase [Thermomicrobiales bacterium]